LFLLGQSHSCFSNYNGPLFICWSSIEQQAT